MLPFSVRTAPIQVGRTRPRETRRKERAKDRGSRQLFFLMGQFMAPGGRRPPGGHRGAGCVPENEIPGFCTATGVDGRPAAVPVLRPDHSVPCDRTERHDPRHSTKFASGISRWTRGRCGARALRGIRQAQQPAGANIPAARNGHASVGMIGWRGRRRSRRSRSTSEGDHGVQRECGLCAPAAPRGPPAGSCEEDRP